MYVDGSEVHFFFVVAHQIQKEVLSGVVHKAGMGEQPYSFAQMEGWTLDSFKNNTKEYKKRCHGLEDLNVASKTKQTNYLPP